MTLPLPQLDEQHGGWAIAMSVDPRSLSVGELEDIAQRLHLRRVDLERALAKQQADWIASPRVIEQITLEITSLDERIQKVRDRLVPLQMRTHT